MYRFAVLNKFFGALYSSVAVLVKAVELSKFVETFVFHMSDAELDGRDIEVRKK